MIIVQFLTYFKAHHLIYLSVTSIIIEFLPSPNQLFFVTVDKVAVVFVGEVFGEIVDEVVDDIVDDVVVFTATARTAACV